MRPDAALASDELAMVRTRHSSAKAQFNTASKAGVRGHTPSSAEKPQKTALECDDSSSLSLSGRFLTWNIGLFLIGRKKKARRVAAHQEFCEESRIMSLVRKVTLLAAILVVTCIFNTPSFADETGAAIFQKADKDGNDQLSIEEFTQHVDDSKHHGERRFARADSDQNGSLTLEELGKYLQKRQASVSAGSDGARAPDHAKTARKALRARPSQVIASIDPLSPGERRPNIVVVLTDDQGYADVSYNPRHPTEVSTPHTDALARAAVICTQGYTTGHVCSPTRAGLITGRYQQRFGIYTAGEGGSGVPLDEVFFPEYLKPAGYVSGVFGKWHMGLTLEYNAVNRGFDEFYGFMGRGAHDYFDFSDPDHPIYRGLEPVAEKGYLTNRITEEAIAFINKHKDRPFFAYVAYNAVHAPPQAPEDDIRHKTGDQTRDVLMAMLLHLDNGVGEIAQAIKDAGVWDDTLFVFLTDNGGSAAMHANNAPLRGFKQQDYEGGIRVPFFVSWPKRLHGGRTCDVPLMSIDILPTALAAAGVHPSRKIHFDGKNMLPALTGQTETLHDALYWSSGGRDAKWAVRRGDWKIVGQKGQRELFNIAEDIGETTDLAEEHPEILAELQKLHDAWLDEMAPPISGSPKKWDPTAPPAPRKKRKRRAAKE